VNPDCQCDCEQCAICSEIEASSLYDEADEADLRQQQELDEA
jgi:hypothetical protein